MTSLGKQEKTNQAPPYSPIDRTGGGETLWGEGQAASPTAEQGWTWITGARGRELLLVELCAVRPGEADPQPARRAEPTGATPIVSWSLGT